MNPLGAVENRRPSRRRTPLYVFENFEKTILFDEGSIYNFFQKTVDIETESRKILSSLSSNEKK